MEIRLHGGRCCGIKHIEGMSSTPAARFSARKALEGKDTSFGRHGVTGLNDAHPEEYPEDFFNEAAPAENGYARLDRLLAFLKTHRKAQIVEITLTQHQTMWFPELEARGFKRVSEGRNSNTGNTIHVFHLVYDARKEGKPELPVEDVSIGDLA